MTPVSAAATEAARQLWADEGLDAGALEEMAAAVEQGVPGRTTMHRSWLSHRFKDYAKCSRKLASSLHCTWP